MNKRQLLTLIKVIDTEIHRFIHGPTSLHGTNLAFMMHWLNSCLPSASSGDAAQITFSS